MAVLIDTDVLVSWERVGTAADARLAGEDDFAISVITASELLHVVHRADGALRARRLAFVEHLLAGLPVLPIAARVARLHASVWADLAGRGQMIGAHDLWIAATALSHDMSLATGNAREFDRVPGLRVIQVEL